MDEKKLKSIVEEVVNRAVDPIKEDLTTIKKTQKDHTRRLESLSGDMEQVLSEIKATRDEIKIHLGLPTMPDTPQV